MTQMAIECTGLSKRFRLGTAAAPDRLSEWLVHWRRVGSVREHWALRDVSFEVPRGEVFGIVGRNGAGKSTLLKILSRITRPTAGRARIVGRVGSLLEVGTGFHGELTGRENVFLNGAILGMSRREVRARFDEIVAFAEVEPFLDTPVKRYSSGMAMRLAFAVAAHLEPEVLILDEVLAVGDTAFQKKCLGKVSEVSRHGRTVLIVSHNLASITNLCRGAILLEAGKIVQQGPAAKVVEGYLASLRSATCVTGKSLDENLPGTSEVLLRSVTVVQEQGYGKDDPLPTDIVDIARPFEIVIAYETLVEGSRHFAGVWLTTHEGSDVLTSATASGLTEQPDAWYGRRQPRGRFVSRCRMPGNFLNEGRYHVSVMLFHEPWSMVVNAQHVAEFDVQDTGAMRQSYLGKWTGVVRPRLDWQTSHDGPEPVVPLEDSVFPLGDTVGGNFHNRSSH